MVSGPKTRKKRGFVDSSDGNPFRVSPLAIKIFSNSEIEHYSGGLLRYTFDIFTSLISSLR
jgi:hypothetical protein